MRIPDDEELLLVIALIGIPIAFIVHWCMG